MSYSTLQKDLKRITLKRDLDQALERMVNFEEEVDRNEEEEEDVESEEEDLEPTCNYKHILGSYLVGGLLFGLPRNINGRSKNN